jgi:chromosome segregation ATPase
MKLNELSLPQLKAIERILESGPVANSTANDDTAKSDRPNGEKMEITELELKLKEAEAAKTDLETKLMASSSELVAAMSKIKELEDKITPLTAELSGVKTEVEDLRKYKATSEEEKQRTEKLKAIKVKVAAAKVEADVDAEADYWLGQSDESLTITLAKLASKPKEAKSEEMKVPPTVVDGNSNIKETVRAFLNEKKAKKS